MTVGLEYKLSIPPNDVLLTSCGQDGTDMAAG